MTRHRLVATLATASLFVAACGGATPSALASPAASAAASASTELVADIDVGGRTLHLVCLGPTDTGEPTILLEAGLESPYQSWGEILLGMGAISEADLQKITAPSLLILGDRDGFVMDVEQAVEMYRLMPNAELAVIPNADHRSAPNTLYGRAMFDFLLRQTTRADQPAQ